MNPPTSTSPATDRGPASVASPRALAALGAWPRRAWVVAGVAAVAVFLLIGLPTDVVPNPLFGRPVDVTWWAPWVLVATAVLSGLVTATYVRAPGTGAFRGPADATAPGEVVDRPGRLAGIAGLLGFFAVGCPVCNKLVVVALGTSGALQWFAPIQPVLAVASVAVLAVVLRVRLRGQVACDLPARVDA